MKSQSWIILLTDVKLLSEDVYVMCFILGASVPAQVPRAVQLFGAGAAAPPQILARLSSPHTHLNQASCSPVSHSQEPRLAGKTVY